MDGLSEGPLPETPGTPESNGQTLLFKELRCALILLCALLAVCLFVDAPFEAALPAAGEAPAPWFFVALQQLLKVLPVQWGGLILPSFAILCLFLLPFPRGQRPESAHAAKNRSTPETWVFLALAALFIGLTVWGYTT